MTAAWAFVLLRRTPSWQPWLAWTVLGLGVVAVVGLLVVQPRAAGARRGRPSRWPWSAGLAGPTGYAIATAATPHTGAIPSAGPSGGTGPGGFAAGGGRPAAAGSAAARLVAARRQAAPVRRAAARGGRQRCAARTAAAGWRRGGPGGFGGLLGSPTPSTQVVALLQRDAGELHLGRGRRRLEHRGGLPARDAAAGDGGRRVQRHRPLPHARAVPGARRGAEDPLVRRRRRGIRQVAERRQRRRRRRSPRWVQQHYTPTTVGGTTLYDLSGAALVTTHTPGRVAPTAGAQVDHKDPTARADIVVDHERRHRAEPRRRSDP